MPPMTPEEMAKLSVEVQRRIKADVERAVTNSNLKLSERLTALEKTDRRHSGTMGAVRSSLVDAEEKIDAVRGAVAEQTLDLVQRQGESVERLRSEMRVGQEALRAQMRAEFHDLLEKADAVPEAAKGAETAAKATAAAVVQLQKKSDDAEVQRTNVGIKLDTATKTVIATMVATIILGVFQILVNAYITLSRTDAIQQQLAGQDAGVRSHP